MNPIIEWMRENYARWNGSDRNIGWYMCVPMTVIAETFGMNLTELGEQDLVLEG